MWLRLVITQLPFCWRSSYWYFLLGKLLPSRSACSSDTTVNELGLFWRMDWMKRGLMASKPLPKA